ncbi:MAG TPA: helix-turn-helix domain-containing protein [Candidatus Acidoferrales bacterium]|nr:helix-turn-helix domain-containing protein [Candidatus Acidoferrales bacterium]
MKSSLSLADAPDVLSSTEVQHILGIGRNATYELLASGKLPSIRITPRRIVVSKKALEAFLRLPANDTAPGPREVTDLGVP